MTDAPPPPKSRKPRYEFIPRAKGTSPQQQADWRAHNLRDIPPAEADHVIAYVQAIAACDDWQQESYSRIVRQMGRDGHPIYGKATLRGAVQALHASGHLDSALV